MNVVNYQITVNLFRIVGGERVNTSFAIEHSGETVNEIFKRAEALLGEELSQFDTITLRKSYR